ncbi:MAG: hypothetical protein ACKODN_02070 [Actinomycetota bacterium]
MPFDHQLSFNSDRAHGFEQLGQLLYGRLAIGTADHQPATLLRLQESRRRTRIRRSVPELLVPQRFNVVESHTTLLQFVVVVLTVHCQALRCYFTKKRMCPQIPRAHHRMEIRNPSCASSIKLADEARLPTLSLKRQDPEFGSLIVSHQPSGMFTQQTTSYGM